MNRKKQIKSSIVTGGLGFIGYNLSLYLYENGIDVTVIDSENTSSGYNKLHRSSLENKGIRIIKDTIGNISKYENIVKNADVIVNCAALISHIDSMKNPVLDLENNTLEHIRFLEYLKQFKDKRIIYTSTRQVYGKQEQFPVNELTPVNPVDSNGINKYTTELYHTVYSQVYDLNILILRLTNIYGKGMHIRDKRLSFIGWFFNRICTNNSIELYGDGLQKRDMLYIDDLIQTIYNGMLSMHKGILNVGGEDSLTLKDIAQELNVLNPKSDVIYIPFPDEIKRIDIGSFQTDNSNVIKILNHKPSTELKNGLKKTYEYYEKYKGYYL